MNRSGSALLLFSAAVLLPSAFVLWFMNEAMRSRDLAVREQLRIVCWQRLYEGRDRVAESLRQWREAISEVGDTAENPLQNFSTLVRRELCSGAVIVRGDGSVAYPYEPRTLSQCEDDETTAVDELLQVARRLEFEGDDARAAAASYSGVFHSAQSLVARAKAWEGMMRCLHRVGNKEQLLVAASDPKLEERMLVDPDGRSTLWRGRLLALEACEDSSDTACDTLRRSLIDRVNDYSGLPMSASERLFLMRELAPRLEPSESFPTMRAEILALRYVEDSSRPAGHSVFATSSIEGVWQISVPNPSGDDATIALFEEETLIRMLKNAIDEIPYIAPHISGTHLRLEPPSNVAVNAFVETSLGDDLPGWKVALEVDQVDLFEEVARRERLVHGWTGALALGGIFTIALLFLRRWRHEMRLAQLKSDLISTVSHELKTPLASMRLLVDTLLAGRAKNETQVTEYLQLIATENARLSRLIDNFLTFSRLERGRHTFRFGAVEAESIVADALSAVGHRFEAPGSELTIDVAANLRALTADRDALVTVLVNLLDNAWKYTSENKRVRLTVTERDDRAIFCVEDNGIGMSKPVVRKAFDRFFQGDQRLSRAQSGFGLGLGIVRLIVEAHRGVVDVSSRPGGGTTACVEIPVNAASGESR